MGLNDLTLKEQESIFLGLRNDGLTRDMARRLERDGSLRAAVIKLIKDTQFNDPLFDYLLTTEEQVERLIGLDYALKSEDRLNLWTKPIRRLVKLNSQRVQSLNDLEFLFVVKDTPAETMRYNYELLSLSQNNLSINSDIYGDSTSLSQNAWLYETPGIYRVRIDFTNKDRGPDIKLAGAEVIGAYAVNHPKLIRAISNTSLPPCELGGIRMGENSDLIVNMSWNPRSGAISVYSSQYRTIASTVPSIISVEKLLDI